MSEPLLLQTRPKPLCERVRVTDAVAVMLIAPQQNWQCPSCYQVLPADQFVANHPRKWCVFCQAGENAKQREGHLIRRADALAQRLISDKGLGRHAMSTVEEFFGELDQTMGGARMYAVKMNEVIDGLMDKGAFTAAGSLLLQLQKLRFLVQKQHSDEDFTTLDLEQKKARLQLEILQFVKEQESDDPAKQFVLESMSEHGVSEEAAAEFQSTLKA